VTVRVQLFATLSRYRPAGSPDHGLVAVEIPQGATVQQLAETLGIPADLPRLALVNGREAELTHRLAAGDEVTLYPPLAGGT
jgi:molybdopterin converting factor small subunit